MKSPSQLQTKSKPKLNYKFWQKSILLHLPSWTLFSRILQLPKPRSRQLAHSEEIEKYKFEVSVLKTRASSGQKFCIPQSLDRERDRKIVVSEVERSLERKKERKKGNYR
jgi:hypothetical protein